MKAISTKLVIDGVLWLLVIYTIFVAARVLWPVSTVARAALLEPGNTFRIEGLLSEDPLVFLLLNTTCKACNENTELYGQLSAQARSSSRRFVVAGPEVQPVIQAWLRTHSVPVDDILHLEDPGRIGFMTFPTLLLINPGGLITDVALHRLTGAQHAAFLARVPLQNSQPAFDNTYYATQIDRVEFESAWLPKEPQIIDIRPRSKWRWPSKQGVRIPSEELRTRAPAELVKERPIVVECTEDVQACQHAGMRLRDVGFSDVALLVKHQ